MGIQLQNIFFFKDNYGGILITILASGLYIQITEMAMGIQITTLAPCLYIQIMELVLGIHIYLHVTASNPGCVNRETTFIIP